jgi:K+-sensing histidine kinase KdpD
MCKKFVGANGSSIEVEIEKGNGILLKVKLPLK